MIKCSSLTKYYPSAIGLENLTLTINRSEIIGLFGMNGSGKSTLLKLIAGLICPTSGSISIDDIAPEKMREKIAYVTEAGSLISSLNAKDHAEFMSGFYPSFKPERFYRLLDFFELPTDKKAYRLSKGQRAKLETAISFSMGADILLMDEPFLGNDIFTKSNFMKAAASLLDGETVIIATHDIETVRSFIDRVVILDRGKLHCNMTVEELYDSNTDIETELSKTVIRSGKSEKSLI